MQEFFEVQHLAAQRLLTGVRPSEEEEIFDDACQSTPLAAYNRQRVAQFIRRPGFLRECDVSRRVQHGHRRAQLVRCVRHELPLLIERHFQSAKQSIEHAGQLSEFVVRIGHGQSRVQAAGADLFRVVRHCHDRSQCPSCDQITANGGHRQRDWKRSRHPVQKRLRHRIVGAQIAERQHNECRS